MVVVSAPGVPEWLKHSELDRLNDYAKERYTYTTSVNRMKVNSI